MATGRLKMFIVAVLLADNVTEQEDELVICVTVIVDDPALVNPVTVKVPVPAVETVIVAVRPLCDEVL